MPRPPGPASVKRAAQRAPNPSPASVEEDKQEREAADGEAEAATGDQASYLSRFATADELKTIAGICVLGVGLWMVIYVFTTPEHADFKNAAWSLLVGAVAAAIAVVFGKRRGRS